MGVLCETARDGFRFAIDGGWVLGVYQRAHAHGCRLRRGQTSLAGMGGVFWRLLAGRRLRFLGAAVRQESCHKRRYPTRSEGQVLSFPQPLPVGKLLAKSKPAVFGEAEDIELLVIYELRGAYLPVILLDAVEVLGLHFCWFGRVGGVSVKSTHEPLRTNPSAVEEREYLPSGPFFGRSVGSAILGRQEDR